ncbi:hypothetical protein BV898_03132 [Hypsibius exemplaris]|uniref:G-protein coupled receptors family 1 profile domain-containing protein n=1 Tax=Hypsibius exemplaris TaxID=2072580 RepID=A0A1W0X661_HYPEX|nr:hypothetical protein BV898_03132 [Hypsibius exemplaris]
MSVMNNQTYQDLHYLGAPMVNSTNSTSNAPSRYYQMLFFLLAVLLTNAAGAIANVILLLAMAIHRPLRKSSSCVLIAQCIVIDLYVTTVAVPLTAVPFYMGSKAKLSANFCRYETLFLYLAYSCGMYAEAVVAVHRLIATVLPQHFALFKRRSSIIGMLLLPWCISVTHAIFPTLGIGSRVIPSSRGGGCLVIPSGSHASFMALVGVGYYFPTVVIGLSYIIVLVKTLIDLRKRKSSRSLRRRLEISRTLFLSFLWHCLTVYPPLIVMGSFPEHFYKNLALQLAIMWLGNSFSAINPVFFWASSQLFQDGIKDVLRYRWIRIRHRAIVPGQRTMGNGAGGNGTHAAEKDDDD